MHSHPNMENVKKRSADWLKSRRFPTLCNLWSHWWRRQPSRLLSAYPAGGPRIVKLWVIKNSEIALTGQCKWEISEYFAFEFCRLRTALSHMRWNLACFLYFAWRGYHRRHRFHVSTLLFSIFVVKIRNWTQNKHVVIHGGCSLVDTALNYSQDYKTTCFRPLIVQSHKSLRLRGEPCTRHWLKEVLYPISTDHYNH